ncbi:MAG TPA: hypothetical protein VMU59_04190 [Caulobacteraceae bacterium]|nr:hypothetical protein [Caulobacteraceae bacterium]
MSIRDGAMFAHKWALAQAWPAAARVTAAAYAVDAAAIMAPSRGRGPRPAPEAWDAKKVAIYLAVCLSGCDYAALGRHVGLHKDTVSSHCADVRARLADADRDEISLEALEAIARGQLQRGELARLDAVRAQLMVLADVTAELVGSSDAHPTFHPTALENFSKKNETGDVVALRRAAR